MATQVEEVIKDTDLSISSNSAQMSARILRVASRGAHELQSRHPGRG
jgi:hypothetical protein